MVTTKQQILAELGAIDRADLFAIFLKVNRLYVRHILRRDRKPRAEKAAPSAVRYAHIVGHSQTHPTKYVVK